MESHVAGAEDRLGSIIQGVYAKEIAPGVAQGLMRDELRRLHSQNRALGVGGWDRMTFERDWAAVGGRLRGDYARMTNLVNDIVSGRATLSQALNRVHGYAGNARAQFFEGEKQAQRQAAAAQSMALLMIRDLGVAEHCVDCVDYYQMGYQFDLPLPGESSRCSTRCRCRVRYRTVPAQDAGEFIGRRS
jgi:hypothetical protein